MNPCGHGGATPSIFGALPLATSSTLTGAYADTTIFEFVDFRTTILNSTVLGPLRRTTYRVVTESSPGLTILKDNENRTVGMIQWQPNATVEIHNAAAKQRVRDWLKLSTDHSRRLMTVRGVQYAWAPMDGFICLYKVNTPAPRVLARIVRVPGKVTLEMTRDAMQSGLLESALVATLMLNCGHSID